jgi:uridine kinase
MGTMDADAAKNFCNVDQLAEIALTKSPTLGNCRLVLIDGPAGSGKSTLANQLGSLLNAEVVHMDDLYEGWDRALTIEIIGKIQTQILHPLQQGQAVRFTKFDWIQNKPGVEVELSNPAVLVIEGVGAASAHLRQFATLTIWIEVEPELGLSRVLARDGIEISEQMTNWQRKEQEWHSIDDTKAALEIWLSGDRPPGAAETEYQQLIK